MALYVACVARDKINNSEAYRSPTNYCLPNKKRRKELNKMPYAEFLQTEEWYQFRREYLKERCEKCGSRYILQLHHRQYRNGRLDKGSVMTLCKACHGEVTKIHQTIAIPVKRATDIFMNDRPLPQKKNGLQPTNVEVLVTMPIKEWENNIYPYLLSLSDKKVYILRKKEV